MNDDLQMILRKATMLLIVAVVVSFVSWGGYFAGGVFSAGLLLVGCFLFGSILTSAADSTDSGTSAAASMKIPLLLTLKFPIVAGGAFVLLTYFPPLSVLLGGTVLVLAILLDALMRPAVTTGEAPHGI
ncbi:MAG: hypothetical protein ACI8S6_000028 [Myxococcota bacterium]|jgi:hypothetical protein